ncbi:MAG: hypothetical protein WCK96_16235 [Methylococcales bacterium]
MTKLFLITATLLALTTNIALATEKPCASNASYHSIVDAQDKRLIEGYEFTITKEGTFTVKQGDKLVYSNCDLYDEVIEETKGLNETVGIAWHISFKDDKSMLLEPAVGEDITGDGVPKLVISYSYHATYCCGSVVIFELGKEFKKIAKIKGGSWGVGFSDINGDKLPEAILTDNHYFGWHSGDAELDYPNPPIVFGWNGTEYVLRPDLMRKDPPPLPELEKQAKLISEDKKWGDKYEVKNIPVALIQNSMRLMYKGHEELGWKFANMAWSSKFPVDDVFFTEWRKLMAQNPIWQAIINNRAMPVSDIKTALEIEIARKNNHK